MPNVDLLYRTLDAVIAAEPEGTWNQEEWLTATECGTACCFAGWALLTLGGQPVTEKVAVDGRPVRQEAVGIRMPNGGLVDRAHIAEVARRRLGLTLRHTEVLFASENTLADLKHYVDEITTTERTRA